jgi:hypothetical protein
VDRVDLQRKSSFTTHTVPNLLLTQYLIYYSPWSFRGIPVGVVTTLGYLKVRKEHLRPHKIT